MRLPDPLGGRRRVLSESRARYQQEGDDHEEEDDLLGPEATPHAEAHRDACHSVVDGVEETVDFFLRRPDCLSVVEVHSVR
ncbi:hypothetical protein HTIA_1728 [Halorhabdus tiamatea SARL4B]|uniref:Uncharacterized protein n=1 Tax=Halorhabdus tiamatea SARL4B TaxID=1033806 RepID=S6D117_9EURY|nr:hypothetical protein HTIA_1728 [Halorhabdus tiamatea SARL4B]